MSERDGLRRGRYPERQQRLTLYNRPHSIEQSSRHRDSSFTEYINAYQSTTPYGPFETHTGQREEFIIYSGHSADGNCSLSSSMRPDGESICQHKYKRRPGSTCKVLLLVTLILLLIGVVVAAVILSVLLSQRILPTKGINNFESTATLLNVTFTDALKHVNSSEFQQLANKFCEAIRAMYTSSTSPIQNDFESCEVLEFTSGSVVVKYRIGVKLYSYSHTQKGIPQLLSDLQLHFKNMLLEQGPWSYLQLDGSKIQKFTKVDEYDQVQGMSTKIQSTKLSSSSSSSFKLTDLNSYSRDHVLNSLKSSENSHLYILLESSMDYWLSSASQSTDYFQTFDKSKSWNLHTSTPSTTLLDASNQINFITIDKSTRSQTSLQPENTEKSFDIVSSMDSTSSSKLDTSTFQTKFDTNDVLVSKQLFLEQSTDKSFDMLSPLMATPSTESYSTIYLDQYYLIDESKRSQILHQQKYSDQLSHILHISTIVSPFSVRLEPLAYQTQFDTTGVINSNIKILQQKTDKSFDVLSSLTPTKLYSTDSQISQNTDESKKSSQPYQQEYTEQSFYVSSPFVSVPLLELDWSYVQTKFDTNDVLVNKQLFLEQSTDKSFDMLSPLMSTPSTESYSTIYLDQYYLIDESKRSQILHQQKYSDQLSHILHFSTIVSPFSVRLESLAYQTQFDTTGVINSNIKILQQKTDKSFDVLSSLIPTPSTKLYSTDSQIFQNIDESKRSSQPYQQEYTEQSFYVSSPFVSAPLLELDSTYVQTQFVTMDNLNKSDVTLQQLEYTKSFYILSASTDLDTSYYETNNDTFEVLISSIQIQDDVFDIWSPVMSTPSTDLFITDYQSKFDTLDVTTRNEQTMRQLKFLNDSFNISSLHKFIESPLFYSNSFQNQIRVLEISKITPQLMQTSADVTFGLFPPLVSMPSNQLHSTYFQKQSDMDEVLKITNQPLQQQQNAVDSSIIGSPKVSTDLVEIPISSFQSTLEVTKNSDNILYQLYTREPSPTVTTPIFFSYSQITFDPKLYTDDAIQTLTKLQVTFPSNDLYSSRIQTTFDAMEFSEIRNIYSDDLSKILQLVSTPSNEFYKTYHRTKLNVLDVSKSSDHTFSTKVYDTLSFQSNTVMRAPYNMENQNKKNVEDTLGIEASGEAVLSNNSAEYDKSFNKTPFLESSILLLKTNDSNDIHLSMDLIAEQIGISVSSSHGMLESDIDISPTITQTEVAFQRTSNSSSIPQIPVLTPDYSLLHPFTDMGIRPISTGPNSTRLETSKHIDAKEKMTRFESKNLLSSYRTTSLVSKFTHLPIIWSTEIYLDSVIPHHFSLLQSKVDLTTSSDGALTTDVISKPTISYRQNPTQIKSGGVYDGVKSSMFSIVGSNSFMNIGDISWFTSYQLYTASSLTTEPVTTEDRIKSMNTGFISLTETENTERSQIMNSGHNSKFTDYKSNE